MITWKLPGYENAIDIKEGEHGDMVLGSADPNN